MRRGLACSGTDIQGMAEIISSIETIPIFSGHSWLLNGFKGGDFFVSLRKLELEVFTFEANLFRDLCLKVKIFMCGHKSEE